MRTTKHFVHRALFILVAALLASGVAVAEVVVVVNPGSGVSSLGKGEVKKLFLGKMKSLPGGPKAAVVEQAPGSPARDAFNTKVLKKNDKKLKAYWSKMIFSGKGKPPKQVANDAEVKALVSSTPGGIGYMDSSAVDDSVSVVLTVP